MPTINISEIVTALIVALVLWVLGHRKRAIAAWRSMNLRRRRSRYSRARNRMRDQLIAEATEANQKVLVRIVPGQPARGIWDGACQDETWHFNRDFSLRSRWLLEGRVSPHKASPWKPPKLGTREPCC
jgi:hypothetical protein